MVAWRKRGIRIQTLSGGRVRRPVHTRIRLSTQHKVGTVNLVLVLAESSTCCAQIFHGELVSQTISDSHSEPQACFETRTTLLPSDHKFAAVAQAGNQDCWFWQPIIITTATPNWTDRKKSDSSTYFRFGTTKVLGSSWLPNRLNISLRQIKCSFEP